MSVRLFLKAGLAACAAFVVACGAEDVSPGSEQPIAEPAGDVRAETLNCTLWEHFAIGPNDGCLPSDSYRTAAANACGEIGVWTGNYSFSYPINAGCPAGTARYMEYSCCTEWTARSSNTSM